MTNRKIVLVPITLELLIQLMYDNYRSMGVITTEHGLPEGAAFVGSTYDPNRDCVNLFFYHESFEPVPLGELVPEFLPTHTVDHMPIELLFKLVQKARPDDEQHDDPEEFLLEAALIAEKANKWLKDNGYIE